MAWRANALKQDQALITHPVYLARHGETESNLAGLYAGGNGEPMTRAGRAQIARLAEQLAGLGLGHIWSSGVHRALESAQLVASHLGLSVGIDHRLDEMRLGPWEGLTEEGVARAFPEDYALWVSQPDEVRLEGRETLAQVAARMTDAVASAYVFEAPVLLMTHVAPIRVTALSALRRPLSHYKQLTVPNACCIRLDWGAAQAAWFPQGTSLQAEVDRAGSVAA